MTSISQVEGKERNFNTALLLFAVSVLSLLALLQPLVAAVTNPEGIKIGDVSSADIHAPFAHSFTSQVLTVERQEAASQHIAPIYTTADTNIARSQIEELRNALSFISSVRADTHADQSQKLSDINSLSGTAINQDLGTDILSLNDSSWNVVKQESVMVLEQVMRSSIRDNRVEDARRGVPNLVSLFLPENQAIIVAHLASGFVAANSLYSEDLTEEARRNAREEIAPFMRSYASQETIVERGKLVDTLDLEALQEFGLARPTNRWQDWVGAIAIFIIMLSTVIIFMRQQPKLLRDTRGLSVIAVAFVLFLWIGRLIIPGHVLLQYVFPMAAFTLIVNALFGTNIALILIIPLVLLTTYNLSYSLELMMFFTLSSMLAVLMPRRTQRISSYLMVGLVIGTTGSIVLVAYSFVRTDLDWFGMLSIIGASFLNGIISAGIAVLMEYFLAPVLGLTTPLQLIELSRPDHPLLAYLMRNAPGTYQHSLQVANMVERAADSIGANGLLARVGALYHDVGKAFNPQYYIENQISSPINPHDDLDAYSSSTIIIRHVPDGLKLARRHNIPHRIRDFIAQHHGTMTTRYQLAKAVEEANGDSALVDISQFRYPGPRPQSRETALLMLSDGVEARARSQKPSDEAALRALIKDTIEDRIAAGQLDDTNLRLKDINTLVDTFANSLRGITHQRIEYPDVKVLDSGEIVQTQPEEETTNGVTESDVPELDTPPFLRTNHINNDADQHPETE